MIYVAIQFSLHDNGNSTMNIIFFLRCSLFLVRLFQLFHQDKFACVAEEGRTKKSSK